jgi:hypothetical protein
MSIVPRTRNLIHILTMPTQLTPSNHCVTFPPRKHYPPPRAPHE